MKKLDDPMSDEERVAEALLPWLGGGPDELDLYAARAAIAAMGPQLTAEEAKTLTDVFKQQGLHLDDLAAEGDERERAAATKLSLIAKT